MKKNVTIERLSSGYLATMDGDKHAIANASEITVPLQHAVEQAVIKLSVGDIVNINLEIELNPPIAI